MPAGFTWPEQNGLALDFVPQINLSDLEKGFYQSLPEHGWLYFFVGDPYAHSIIPHRVLFFDGSVDQLVRVHPFPGVPVDQVNQQTTLIRFITGFTVNPYYRSQVLYPPIDGRIPPQRWSLLPT